MSEVTVSNLKARIEEFINNPAAIQRAVLESLRTATAGDVEIVDPTNPFVFLLESASVLTATAVAKSEANTRRQYPSVGQTVEDLYLHMSDRDYVDRFAQPAKTSFCMLLQLDELLGKLVTDAELGCKKVVIPRNTNFTVADTVFSLQYPIEIRQMNHGGLQVVYDAKTPSPLQELSTNLVTWEIRTGQDNLQYLYLEFDVAQFKIQSQTGSLNAATDYRVDIQLSDQFYFARVYVQDSLGAWQEIRTTHSEQIYDPTDPTAVLKVVGQTLTVRIPQIYTSSGQLRSAVRTDVYETKGPLDLNLSSYPFTAFTTQWLALDRSEQTIYTAPLKTLRTVLVYSNRFVSGGAPALSYQQLRSRVLRNAVGQPTLPITNARVEAELERNGYGIVRNVDTITNRVFLATRPMPKPDDERLITAAAASIETVNVTLEELAVLDSVTDNGTSLTVSPDTLYQIRNGVVKPVPSAQVQALLALPVDQRAVAVTQGGYLYTPFHYVLDASQDEFSARPYYLDSPSVETKIFVAENDTTGLQVSTRAYAINRTATGYSLQIAVTSNDAWKALRDDEVFVQLAYVPHGELDRAYLQGQLVGKNSDGERLFTFNLSTTFHVDAEDGLELTQFKMFSEEPRITKADLLQDFEVLYSTTAVMPETWRQNNVDAVLGKVLLPTRIAGVMQEKLRLRFGWSLHRLWSRARSVVSTMVYQTWEADVPRYYEKDVYAIDPLTGSAFGVDGDGNLTYTILHHQGEPVLDAEGNQVYQWRKGDTKLDGNGQPIVLNERGMMRQIDFMLLEGVYWFASDPVTLDYRTKLTRTVVEWLTNDLEAIDRDLLEQTHLYFYPKNTLGSIEVMINNGTTTTVSAAQAFHVALYVSATVYSNTKLRQQLGNTTVRVLSEQLKAATVSLSGIVMALRQAYGNDVIDVEVEGLGAEAKLAVLTVLDEGNRCAIRKRLLSQADDSLIVQEDVTLQWIRHEKVI